MNALIGYFSRFYANQKLFRTVCLLFAAALILRFPKFFLANFSEGLSKDICSWCETIVRFGGYVALTFVKQSDLTGNGTAESPLRKPDPASPSGNKTILSVIVALVLVPALFLSGCAITPETKAKLSVSFKQIGTIAGRGAVAILEAAPSFADAKTKADYLATAALALRHAEANGKVVNGADVTAFVTPYLPDKPHWHQLAETAGALVDKAAKSGINKDTALETVAVAFDNAAPK